MDVRELLLVPNLQMRVGIHLMDIITVRKQHALLGRDVAAREGDVSRIATGPTTLTP